MLEWLKQHGVEDVVWRWATCRPRVRNVLGDGSAYGLRLRYVEEPDPRGTAGALKFAESLLDDRSSCSTATSSPTSTSPPRSPARAHRRVGTLALAPVPDPSAYGLVRLEADTPCASSSRSPARTRSTPTSSPPAPTCSSARPRDGPARHNVSIEREVWLATRRPGALRLPLGRLLARHRHPDRYLRGTFDII